MSGMPGTKRAAETDPPSSSSSSSAPSESRTAHGGGGGGLYGITAAQKAFLFLDGPADVLRAATACRRWRELAGASSVWQAKAEREGILDKAAAFEVEVPWMQAEAEAGAQKGGQLEDEGTAAMALYGRVFVLKVRGRGRGCEGCEGPSRCRSHHLSHPRTCAPPPPPPPLCRGIR